MHLGYFHDFLGCILQKNVSQSIWSCLICDIPHTVWNLADQVTIVVKLWQCAEETQILSAGMHDVTAAHLCGLQTI